MNGTLICYDGTQATLPELLEWSVRRTDGTGADSVSVRFLFRPEWEEKLKKATGIRLWEGTVDRFCGIVDEYEVTDDHEGLTVAVYGRGMGGLMMDNQVPEGVYYYAGLQDMIRRYVSPYGIQVKGDTGYWLYSYAVDYGTSCWDAFSGFCLWASGVQPRFLGDGTMLLSSAHGTERALRGQEKVLEAVRRGCRYGVYSTVAAKSILTGYETLYENREFQAMGGCATHRMTVPRKNPCRAGRLWGQRVLDDSKKGWSLLTVTVQGAFWAEPMDPVQVDLSRLGLQGRFLVTECESVLDREGERSKVTMRELL